MSAEYQDENERLVAEQAVLAYREVHKAMQAAPHGQGLVVLAGTSWSFDMASQRLKEFCGLSVSDQSIRRETEAMGVKAASWQQTSPESIAPFQQAGGQKEL